jgi:diguanylate cyclase (GGDEF)-like protein/hemerythrin-like metal-binding protein/PAS domain S-box-containing protein
MLQRSVGPAAGRAAGETHLLEILGLLLDSSPALVGLKDLDGRYVFANHELEALFGLKVGAVVGRRDAEFMPAEAAASLAAKDGAVLSGGLSIKSLDEFAVGERVLSCATVRFPYRSEDGQIVGSGFVAIDIRDQKGPPGESQLSLASAQQTIDELKRAVDEMTLRASTDVLTNAKNRAAFTESAQLEISRLERYGHPVSLIFMDIDHFKQVNDVHGHAAGDAVLQGFCSVVRSCIRATDLLGRWGGEEFVLLLPNNGLTSAGLLAERIRAALPAHPFAGVGVVSASFGVAQCQPGEGWEAWLARADAALYRAKDHGRNRVELDVVDVSGKDDVEQLDVGFVRLIWRPAYESGHAAIDRQHKELFEDANSLLSAVINDYPEDQVKPLIEHLIAKVAAHFGYEETVFRATAFAAADKHASIHRALIGRSMELAEKYATGDLQLGELFYFLAYDVVAKHILSEDRKFFAFIDRPATPEMLAG